MYDREFFTSKLGVAALVSIAAMVTFNVFALTHQLGMTRRARGRRRRRRGAGMTA